jgi:hypothetical protein
MPWIFDQNGIKNPFGGLFGIFAKMLVDGIDDI